MDAADHVTLQIPFLEFPFGRLTGLLVVDRHHDLALCFGAVEDLDLASMITPYRDKGLRTDVRDAHIDTSHVLAR